MARISQKKITISKEMYCANYDHKNGSRKKAKNEHVIYRKKRRSCLSGPT